MSKSNSIFAGIGQQGAGLSKRPFLEVEATNTVEVQGLKYIFTRKKDHIVILDYKVLESSDSELTGKEFVNFFYMSGNKMDVHKGQLNKLVLCCLNLDVDSDKGRQALNGMEDHLEEAVSDTQPLKGAKVAMNSVHNTVEGKNPGQKDRVFTNLYWERLAA